MKIKALNLLVLPLLIALVGCGDLSESLKASDMILQVNFSETDGLLADGRTIQVEAVINPNAKADTRKVLFTSNGGSFKGAENDELIVDAIVDSEIITAKANFIAPLEEGQVVIFVQMDLPELRGKYVAEELLVFSRSDPDSISLSADSFSVFNGFDGEINIRGELFNTDGNTVNSKTQVVLIDLFADNSEVEGRFRDNNLFTNNASEISATYSPGNITADQTIKIVANVLDENGVSILGIADTLYIEVIEKP